MDKQHSIRPIAEELAESTRFVRCTVLASLGLKGKVRRLRSYAANIATILGLTQEGKRRLNGYCAEFDEAGNTNQIDAYSQGRAFLRIEITSWDDRIATIRYVGSSRHTLTREEYSYSKDGASDVVRISESRSGDFGGGWSTECVYRGGLLARVTSFSGDKEESKSEYVYSNDGRLSEILTIWASELPGSGWRPHQAIRYKYDEHGNVVSEVTDDRHMRLFGYIYNPSGNVLDLTEYADGRPKTRTRFSYDGNRRTFARRCDVEQTIQMENVIVSEFYDANSNCTRRTFEVAQTRISGIVVIKPVKTEYHEIEYY